MFTRATSIIDYLSIPAMFVMNYIYTHYVETSIVVSEITLLASIVATIALVSFLYNINTSTKMAIRNSLKAYGISLAIAAFILSITNLQFEVSVPYKLGLLALAIVEAIGISALYGKIDTYTVIIAVPLIYAYPLKGLFVAIVFSYIIYKLFEK